MDGQVAVVSFVVITGVVIGLVGVTYFYAAPLLDKQSARTVFQGATDFVTAMNGKVIDIANAGGGETSFEIPFGGSVEIIPDGYPDPENNSIKFLVPINQPLALNSSATYIGGASFADVNNQMSGTFGTAKPSFITFNVVPSGTRYIADFTIRFRELVKMPTLERFKISLAPDSSQVLRGTNTLVIGFDGQMPQGQMTLTKMRFVVS